MSEALDIAAKWGPVILTAIIIPALRWGVRKGLVTQDDFKVYLDRHDTEHKVIGKRLDEGQQLFTRFEAELRHLPTRKDIDELKASLAGVDRNVVKLDGSIRVVAAKLGAVEKPVDLLMGHHLDEEHK